MVAALTGTTMFYQYLSEMDKWAVFVFVLLTLINIGALLEQRTWIYYLEAFRLIFLFAFFFYSFQIFEWVILPIMLLTIFERRFSIKTRYNKYMLST